MRRNSRIFGPPSSMSTTATGPFPISPGSVEDRADSDSGATSPHPMWVGDNKTSGVGGGGPVIDVVVLGSGVAGLTAALALDRAGLSVTVLTKAGVAAALAPPDSPELHFSDTVSAGGGLCDPDAVRVLVGEGPLRLRELIALGAAFDRTGFEVERALVAAVAGSGVEAREGWLATRLLVTDGRVAGVAAVGTDGSAVEVPARQVVLASGGAGQLFAVTTNPVLSTGDGVAMALQAGAAVADLEFMQFHPTALSHPAMPRPLLSEALRGEGARLRDEQGVAFMGAEHPLGDLAP